MKNLVLSILLTGLVICDAFPGGPVTEQAYKLEAYQRDGDTQTLILRLQPSDGAATPSVNYRQGRQEDEDDGGEEAAAAAVPATTPFIPAIIPGLTKIFTGIITGNLNEIFHGSTSFAPQNVSHAIDSVYNQVVGIAPPVSTLPPGQQAPVTQAPGVAPAAAPGTQAQPAAAAPGSAPAAAAPVAASPSGGIGAGQPLAPLPTQASVAPVEASTTKATSNEDDEDESENERFGFGRAIHKLGRNVLN